MAGFSTLVAAPYAWSAAAIIEIPDWMPSFVGLVIALGAIAIAAFTLRVFLRVTHGEFEVHSLQAAGGVLILLIVAAMIVGLAVQLPDPDSYKGAINDDGEITVGPTMFLASGLILTVVYEFLAWLGAYLYTHALTDMEPNRISRRLPGEVDGVGELLRERQ
jgi:nitrate reductase gamma subunit